MSLDTFLFIISKNLFRIDLLPKTEPLIPSFEMIIVPLILFTKSKLIINSLITNGFLMSINL